MKLNKEKLKNSFLILSWAMYDLSNQFFALNIVSLYFVRWLTLQKHKPEIFYSVSFGISTFFVAILGVVLGGISDITQRRRPFLVYLTLLSVIFTMLLGRDNIFLALLFFAIANFGCQTAIVFYNSLMVNIVPGNRIGLVSGLGKMFGYSGAVLALYIFKPIVLKSGYQATFLTTGFLFLIFSLPCLVFVKDRAPQAKIGLFSFFKKDKIAGIFKSLKATAFGAQSIPGLLDFLKAVFFGLCAVNAIVLFMSVYATRAFGLNEVQVINLITYSTFFAMAGSICSGFLSDYLGHKRVLSAVFVLWIISFFGGAFAKGLGAYWLIGAMTGVALGSTWVVGRALAVTLVPQEKIGEIFGLYNLVSYVAAIAGALFWGLVLLILSPYGEWGYRVTLLSLVLFMAIGLIFLLRLPDNKNKI